MAAWTLVTLTLSHRLFMRSLESSCKARKYMSLFICVCRQAIAKTGKNIAVNTTPVVNVFILYRTTGISVITRLATKSSIAVDMMAVISTVAMITGMTTGAAMTTEMTIGAIKVMTTEKGIIN
jgi:hypothetical protein